jgi:hypothetical protein
LLTGAPELALRPLLAGCSGSDCSSDRADNSEAMAMTEAEWLLSRDGKSMWNKVPKAADSERKARLFAAACLRHVWVKLGKSGRKLTEFAEAYADAPELGAKPRLSRFVGWLANWKGRIQFQYLMRQARDEFAYDLISWASCDMEFGAPFFAYNITDDAERFGITFEAQARLVHDLVGNPFRPANLNSSWRTSNVTALAQSIYEDRAFDRLPILADALEDAGCDNADILNHCRQPGEHVRGCWVVDLVLRKE